MRSGIGSPPIELPSNSDNIYIIYLYNYIIYYIIIFIRKPSICRSPTILIYWSFMVLPKLYLILLSIKAEQEEIVSDLLWKKILLPTLTYKDFLLWGHLTYPGRGTSIKEVRCQYPKIWILFPFWAYIAFSIWIEHLTSVNLKVLKFKDEHLFSDPEFCHSGPDNSSFWRLPVYPRVVTAASVWDAFNTLTFPF